MVSNFGIENLKSRKFLHEIFEVYTVKNEKYCTEKKQCSLSFILMPLKKVVI